MAKAVSKPIKSPAPAPKTSGAKAPPPPPEMKAKPAAQPSELVIREIMIQKSVSREKAIEILQNPSK